MNECTGQQSFKMKSWLCVACVLLLHLMVNLSPSCLCDSGNGTTSVSESGNGPASGSGEQQFSDGDIRLVGGGNEREGRVEVFYGGQWGTVCGDRWMDRASEVVCRQLDFFQHGKAVVSVQRSVDVFAGESLGPIHMDNVRCYGTETQLFNCSFEVNHDCTHSQDVGVICPGNCSDGAIRLMNGRDQYEGRVEVCFSGLWGTVCDNHWDTTEAEVVCTQLGLLDISKQSLGVGGAYFGEGRDPILLNEVSCKGREENLIMCTYEEDHNCKHSEDVGVFCRGGKNDCRDDDIRLTGSQNEREGVVEICFQGVWGTMCSDYLTYVDYYLSIEGDTRADVICRQLGFLEPNTSALSVGVYEYNDVVSRHVVLLDSAEITCEGNEEKFSKCAGYAIGTHSCSIPSGVGIRCPGNCTNGDVRLAGGRNAREGRVEVCWEGHWVVVCHDRWTHREAEVVCRQLNFWNTSSTVAAITGRSFGSSLWGLYTAACDSDAARLDECHTDIGYCSSEESAGVICEVNCKDEGTKQILHDERKADICKITIAPSLGPPDTATADNHLEVVITVILVPLLFIILVLMIMLTVLVILLRRWRKNSGQVLQSFANPLQRWGDNREADLSPTSPTNPPTNNRALSQPSGPTAQETSLLELRSREASLPHLYESLRGQQQLWLSSPKSGCLDVLQEEEERGAAAKCSDAAVLNAGSSCSSHPYAILEVKESIRCKFAGPDSATFTAMPSPLAASSLDNAADGSMVAAALSLTPNTLSLGLDLDPFSSHAATSQRRIQSKESAVTGFSYPGGTGVENHADPGQEKSVYDCLEQKAISKSQVQPAGTPIAKVEGTDSRLQSGVTGQSKGGRVDLPGDQESTVYDRLKPESVKTLERGKESSAASAFLQKKNDKGPQEK